MWHLSHHIGCVPLVNLPVIYMYIFLEIPCHHLTLLETIQICYSSLSSLKQDSLQWAIFLLVAVQGGRFLNHFPLDFLVYKNYCLPVTSHSCPVRAVPRLFKGCFEQKLYIHSWGPYGPQAAPYKLCLPIRGPYCLNACIISLQAPHGFKGWNSPGTAHAGTVMGPHRPRTATYDACAGFLQILVVSIPLRVHLQIEDSCVEGIWCPYGHHTGSMWSSANYSIKP